ncbi:MAG: 7TM diverse intracellular signaling domain-containing protein, partial [Spirochaetota bacterium]
MKLKIIHWILLFLISHSFIKLSAKEAVYKINTLDKEYTLDSKVAGKWSYTQQTISPAKNINQQKITWKQTPIPSNLYKVDKNLSKKPTVWLRKDIVIAKIPQQQHMSIKLGIITDADRVYINGVLIGQHGELQIEEVQGYDKLRIYPIPDGLLQENITNTVLVYIESNVFTNYLGISENTTSIGPSILVKDRIQKQEYLSLCIIAVYFAFGSYFLFLAIRRRKEKENLLFGLFTTFMASYLLLRKQIKYDFSIHLQYLKKIEYLILPLLLPSLYHFIRTYFKRDSNWLFKICDGILCVIFFTYLIINDVSLMSSIHLFVTEPIWVIYLVGMFHILFSEWRKKNVDASYFLISQAGMV